MKKTRFGLLAAAALWAVPTSGWAQDATEGAAEEPAATAETGEAAAGEEAGAAAEGEAAEGEPAEGGEGLGDICEIDPAACPTLDMKKEAAKPLPETILAVQQRFIIKKGRFEVQPSWGFTLNDQFVSHNAPSLALNYYVTEALAVGLNGNYYRPFNVDQEFNAQVRRAGRIGVPLTEYDWGAALNFTYVPANGKFAGFGDFIFHYDAYVVGGVGAISTRPIPVMDPENRNFDFEPKVALNAGLGLKIFFNRWFAAVLEVRDYIFLDKLENLEVDEQNPTNKDNWFGDSSLTNNVQAQLGFSVFIPFSFDYRLPKAGADSTGAQ
jgi:outer membrane beta-barrel protein